MTTAIIPARWASSRFPGKPLIDLAGKPMIRRVCERVLQAQSIDRVIVATDDRRIATACEGLDVEVMMTSGSHRTGTDRIAEVAARIGDEVLVNVQGDEPLIDPVTVDLVGGAVTGHSRDAEVATACFRADPGIDVTDPAVVLVTKKLNGEVLALSRWPIPHGSATKLVHVGLYAFTADALGRYASWAPGPIERSESIELYRFLERGEPVVAIEVGQAAPSVDTPEDALAVVELIESSNQG